MSEIILTNLTTETLAEMAAEKAALVEQHGRKTVQAAIDCGRYLTEIKSRLAHGEWLPWLEENFPHAQQHANRYMVIAANYTRVSNLEEASSIREALRMIGEAEESAGTKRTRKAAADPAPEVEVIDNRPAARPVEDVPTVTKSFFDSDDLPPEEPPSLPKTNTLHSPATQQRIDRGPDPAPPTVIECGAGLTPLQHVLARHTRREVLVELVSGYEGEQRKRVFADIRAFVDEFDPQPVIHDATERPAKRGPPAKHPTADQLMFVAEPYATKWSGQLMTQVCKWAEYKQSLAGNAKVRSLASWDAMLTRIDNVQKMRGPGTVCEMINKAIANGWQGWEHDSSSGKPTVASTRIDSGEDYSDLEYRTA
jgi:hypothetical protein